jgi:3-oxoacyl-[acyl-carrier protein] reductase
MDLSLNGKTALIGGSTQGIGLAAAIELASMGAACILLARDESKLKEAVAKLDTNRQQLHTFEVADFNYKEQVQRAVEKIVAKTPINILINNTGGPAAGPLLEASEDAFEQTFRQHLICNQILAKTVVPGMKASGYGRIINIISTSVKTPLKNLGVSNTIRGAVASWAKTLSGEVAAFGITVNNVLPGSTLTNRLHILFETTAKKLHVSYEEVKQTWLEEIPMRRFGDVSEIAAVIAFLSSPAASYVTGVNIQVDGGKTPVG